MSELVKVTKYSKVRSIQCPECNTHQRVDLIPTNIKEKPLTSYSIHITNSVEVICNYCSTRYLYEWYVISRI